MEQQSKGIRLLLAGLIGLMACNNTEAGIKPEPEADIATDSAKQAYAAKVNGTIVKAPETPYTIDTTKQYIYITFDDGPQPGTMGCYNTCKDAGVKATFFMVGLHQLKKSDGKKLVGMIRNSYPQFLLANHSYDHAQEHYKYFYQHPDMAFQTFLRAQDSLQVPKKIIRLPGNGAWVKEGRVKASHLVSAVAHQLDSAGFNVIGWDLEWNFNHKDARPVQSPEKLAAQIDSAFARNQTQTKNHLVLLSHDRMFQRTPDSISLVRFIQILKKNPKYVFETVDHYPGLKK